MKLNLKIIIKLFRKFGKIKAGIIIEMLKKPQILTLNMYFMYIDDCHPGTSCAIADWKTLSLELEEIIISIFTETERERERFKK